MSKKLKIIAGFIVVLLLVSVATYYIHNQNIAVLNPAGPIAQKERNLIYFGLALSLIVVIPVFGMVIFFAWKYRETNSKAKYRPDWDRNKIYETIWWGIPTILIFTLSVVAWRSSHTLDPFVPLNSSVKPLTIQVISLDWKWLFIYPKQQIATVNYVQMPVSVPVNFNITSDAPMNSFWIPQLGGQIYAMPGMSTELHLMASKTGDYYGSSANISGAGFANMHFIAQASSSQQFNQWVQNVSQSPIKLTPAMYEALSKPSDKMPVTYYSLKDSSLFNDVISKYLVPNSSYGTNADRMTGMGT